MPSPFPAMLGIGLLVAGCALQMPLSRDLATRARAMPVDRKASLLTDRIHWIHFGPFRAEGIRKQQTPAEWNGRLGHARLQAEAEYGFRLASGTGEAWTCACRNHAEREDYFPSMGPVRELGYRISLDCGFRPDGGGSAWRLTLMEADSSGRVLRGILSDGSRSVAVAGTRDCLGKKSQRPEHTGFRFRDAEGASLGAVELIGRQRVWLGEKAGPEVGTALAAASASLLLYEDLNQRIKDEVQNKLVYGIQVFSAALPAD